MPEELDRTGVQVDMHHPRASVVGPAVAVIIIVVVLAMAYVSVSAIQLTGRAVDQAREAPPQK